MGGAGQGQGRWVARRKGRRRRRVREQGRKETRREEVMVNRIRGDHDEVRQGGGEEEADE